MNDTFTFRTYKTNHPSLKGLVAYYYIHKSENPQHSEKFQYYPHYRNGLTTYVNSNVDFTNLGSTVTPDDDKPPITLFSRNYDAALAVNLHGPFYKLGIAFEPLGLNHFIDQPLSEVAPERVSAFNNFGREYHDLVKDLFNSNSSPVEILDEFLVSRKSNFSNNRLQSVLNILFEKSCDFSIQTLSESQDISRKTLLRDFQKDLDCSVKTYQKLIRFRQALNNYQQASKKISFTELALEFSYYDQPAFIKNFKQITGYSPRNFFQQLKQYGQADTFWRTD